MPESIGQFEQIVLTAILSLRDEAYGVTIHKKAVQLATPKNISLGAVYVTLDRLEDKGLISSWLSDPTPERVAAPNASIVRFSFFAASRVEYFAFTLYRVSQFGQTGQGVASCVQNWPE